MTESLGAVIPIARHFIACQSVSFDGADVTLRGLVATIRPEAGEQFPLMLDSLVLFAQVTQGQGQHHFQLQVVCYSSTGEELSIRTSPSVRIDLGPLQTAIHGLPIPLTNLVLEEAGRVEFRLYCDGQEIAQEMVRVEDLP